MNTSPVPRCSDCKDCIDQPGPRQMGARICGKAGQKTQPQIKDKPDVVPKERRES